MCHWLSPCFGSCLNNDGTGLRGLSQSVSRLPLLLISWCPLFSHYFLSSTSVPASINLSFLWLGAIYTHHLFYLNPLTSVPSSTPSERNSRFPPPRSFSWVPTSQTKPNKPGASSLCTSRLNRTLYHSIELFVFFGSILSISFKRTGTSCAPQTTQHELKLCLTC